MKIELMVGLIFGIVLFLFYTTKDVATIIVLGMVVGVGYMMFHKKGGQSSKFTMLEPNNNFDFAQIGGQEVAKRELKEALDFLIRAKEIKEQGIRPLKGVLLTGPPGTGKTLMAKAAASYSDAVFISTSGSEFIEMYAGVGAKRVRDIFQSAKDQAKKQEKDRAIIFIDEIDVLGAKRGGSSNSHLEYEQTLNQFLVELDGLGKDEDINILVIGATNRPDLLDSALVRPGRFDRQVKVDLPSLEARKQILGIHLRNKKITNEICVEHLAKETYGFSGAQLENAANEAAILAMRDNTLTITKEHFKEAIDKVMLGEKQQEQMTEEVRERIAIHECAHALVGEVVEPNSVAQLSIVSRGKALGHVRQQYEDQQLYTATQVKHKIRVCLAGAIAEELYLGEKSTGASNDFQKAIDLAKLMISGGLSSWGIISLEELPKKDRAEAIKEVIGIEEQATKEILIKYEKEMKQMIRMAREKEIVTGEEIRNILQVNDC